MPNYPQYEIYEAYKGKRYVVEDMNGLTLHRSSIYVSKNKSIINRLRNYFSFVISSARQGRRHLGTFDFLLCESPPLFLGYSAMYLAKRTQAQLIFNVSDLWPESAEKLGVVNNAFLLRLAYRLEAKLYQRAILVTGQTQGICKSINQRFPKVKTYWLPNGVDLSYYHPDSVVTSNWRNQQGFQQNDFILLYAGIIGIAQGLEIILNAAEHFKTTTNIKFVLLGSGPEKERLQILKTEKQLNNVFFLEAITKTQMPSVLKSVNAAIIPLRKLDLFLGAIPSKLFETLSMEVPVLLGVDGEAKDLFITKGQCGLFFEPENVLALVETIHYLVNNPEKASKMGQNGRRFVQQHFNRDTIAQLFFNQLKTLT